MTKFLHKLSIVIYISLIIATFVTVLYYGYPFYRLPIEERFPADELGNEIVLNTLFQPSGLIGHGLGIVGTILIVLGLVIYTVRKRVKAFAHFGILKYWLEFHIFLCTLGTVMVLFHTSFKFGGIISVGFWSLVVVWLSGFVGRYLIIQIPRTVEGRELSLQEVKDIRDDIDAELLSKYEISYSDIHDKSLFRIKYDLKTRHLPARRISKIRSLIRQERYLDRRIKRLNQMHELFRYWHVFHLPFSFIMLIIMVIHVIVSLIFGYFWIFKY